MFFKKAFIVPALLSIVLLSGCAAVAVGTATTTGAAVVHDRRTTGTVIDDQTIELKALGVLYGVDNIRINTHVNATCYNGILLLTGEAPTESLRNDIANRLRKIPKVRKVLNKIKGFDPTRVKIVSENGVVYLLGILKQHEVTPVIETVRRVGGVQRVVKLFEITD